MMWEKTTAKMYQFVLITLLLLPVVACADKETASDVQTVKAKTEAVVNPASKPATKVLTNFQKDVHYVELFSPVPVSAAAGEVEVVEMFWYGCPHCYKLEPHLQNWKKTIPKDLQIVKIPASLNPAWKLHARAFYAAEIMGVFETLNDAFFQSMNEQQRKLKTEDAVIRFVESQGIDGKKFREAMNSMSVDTKVARSLQLGRQYGVTGVPALVVGGKYRVLGSGVRSYEEMFQVVDFLADKVRGEQ